MAGDASALDLAMAAGGEDLGFWRAFADQELFLLLTEEPQGPDLSPQVFDLTDGRLVLVFDREDRLAAFSPVPMPYAALPGRVVARLAFGQDVSVGVNLGSGAVSETVLPVQALGWLLEALDSVPVQESLDQADQVAAPRIDARGLVAVEAALRGAGGLAEEALLADVVWTGGRRGTLLAFLGVTADGQPAVARAVAEALALSGLDAAALDVGFPGAETGLVAQMRQVGRRWRPQAPPEVPALADGPREMRVPILK